MLNKLLTEKLLFSGGLEYFMERLMKVQKITLKMEILPLH